MGQHNDGETWNDFGSWREVSPICSDSLECTDIEFDSDEEGGSESGPEMQQHENDEDGVDGQEENDDDKVDGLSDVNEDRVAEEEVLGDPIGSESEGEQPNRGTSFRVSESGRIVLQVGQLFRNVNEFRQVILDFSIQEGFRLKRVKNEKRRVTCGCEVEGCPWRVHGSPTYDRVTYMLKTFNNVHTCLSVPKNKDVSARWIGKKFESIIKDNPGINVRVLQSIVLRKYGVQVPDYTLHRAKKFALARGEVDHKESYNKLYKYGHVIIERNPGSCVKLSTIRYDPNTNVPAHFNRFFLSFYAQKMGYLEGCRPFIGLDGCHLKGPYDGILLCAIGIDANCGVYPIALGVVEIESLDSWHWFIQLLYDHVGKHESRTVCFMTDRQKGIVPALDTVWPNHVTRFCGRHILQNLMSRYKVDYLRDLFWPAARSSNLADFNDAMKAIKETSAQAAEYLMRIPLHYWSVHQFDHQTTSDHNTNNVVEAFNSWMIPHRAQPLMTMMENVRRKFMKRLRKRYEDALKWPTDIPPAIRRQLQRNQTDGRYFDPLRFAAETSTAAGCLSIAAGPSSSAGPLNSAAPTITRVLWFPSNQQGTSSQGNTSNEHFASQPLTPTAPQYSQPSQGAQRK
ncbi:hypothetical protein ACOSP7_011866 [Xanthoceras sorbifolium]